MEDATMDEATMDEATMDEATIEHATSEEQTNAEVLDAASISTFLTLYKSTVFLAKPWTNRILSSCKRIG
jgi:hypothetical protein